MVFPIRKWIYLLPLALILITFSSCSTQKRITRQNFAFDTVINITADKKNVTAIDEAFSICLSYEKIFSRTDSESELFLLNNRKISSPSEDILKILDFSLKMSSLTDGAFDITVAPLSDLWNVAERNVPPTEKEIKTALSTVGYKNISLNPLNLSEASLDLGAVAKGYIADRLTEYFTSKELTDIIIDLGGNVAVLGKYTVGIRDPFNPDKIFATISINNKSAVTSGAYQRYFEHNGRKYHHIIDPRSGMCADSGIASVTVISPSSMYADALSTSIFVMGEDALSLCESFPDTDALIIMEDRSFKFTENFEEKYNFSLVEKK